MTQRSNGTRRRDPACRQESLSSAGLSHRVGRRSLCQPPRNGQVSYAGVFPACDRELGNGLCGKNFSSGSTRLGSIAGPVGGFGTKRPRALPLSDGGDPCIAMRAAKGSSWPTRRFARTCRARSSMTRTSRASSVHVTRGVFDVNQGSPVAGPPTRALPRVKLEQRATRSTPSDGRLR